MAPYPGNAHFRPRFMRAVSEEFGSAGRNPRKSCAPSKKEPARLSRLIPLAESMKYHGKGEGSQPGTRTSVADRQLKILGQLHRPSDLDVWHPGWAPRHHPKLISATNSRTKRVRTYGLPLGKVQIHREGPRNPGRGGRGRLSYAERSDREPAAAEERTPTP